MDASLPNPPELPPGGQPAFVLGHRPALDGLRGLACLLVVGYHLETGKLPGGHLGVTLFFVLSGFLITALLLREWQTRGTIDLGAFYVRRTLRLLPALAVLLLVCWLLARALLSPEIARAAGKDVLSIVLYHYNWRRALSPAVHPTFLEHCWSLAVEEQFYLAWPVLLLVLLRLRVRRRRVLLLLVAGIVASAAARAALWHGCPSYPRVYYCTDTRGDALLTGCLVGLLVSWDCLPHSRRASLPWHLAGLVAVMVLSYHVVTRAGSLDNRCLYRGGMLVCTLGMGVLLCSLLLCPSSLPARLLERPVLAWFGRISYGLYLWHFPLFLAFEPALPGRAGRALIFALSVVLASLSYYGIEKPLLGLVVSRNDKPGRAAPTRRGYNR